MFRKINLLYQKELQQAFFSPLPYVLSAAFVFIMGVIFFSSLSLAGNEKYVSITMSIVRPLFANMNFLFLLVIPMFSMRTFAEEKKQQTLPLLFSSLTHMEIILGKFLATVTMISFMMALTLIFPIILISAGFQDWSILFCNYLGTFLNTCAFVAIGIFASSITENQIISGVISFCILLLGLLMAQTPIYVDNYLVAQILAYMSFLPHLSSFSYGVIRSSDLIYYFSVVGYFLFLTQQVLNSRKWA